MKTVFVFFKGNQKVEVQTVAYSLNFFLPKKILIFLSLIKKYELSAEVGIVISINYLLTQVFSSNARSLIIAKNNLGNLIVKTFFFRILISLFVAFVSIYLIIQVNFLNKLFLINISAIIIQQWIVEIILLNHEIKKKYNFFYNYIIFSFLFIGIYFFSLYFFSKSSLYILLIYNLSLGFIILQHLFINNLKNLSNVKFFKKLFVDSIKTYSFLSSFFIQLTNLIWRILILFFCGKIIAGILFSSFAIGSLPSTIFNTSFGPTIHKKKLALSNTFKNIIFFYFIFTICLFLFSLNKIIYYGFSEVNFQLLAVSISMVGSFFMIKGTSNRQYFIQNTKYKNLIFKIDIIYSVCILAIVPLLYYFGGAKLIILSFFIASIFSYFFFSVYCKRLIKVK
ncbi:MAG: hypothetical protein H8E55_10395 [Pelagibacterales bacterium]|nr:hypothetical protein [Pelagibacterales bacterium]